MDIFWGFIIQLTGFYFLYSTSDRAVFVKRKHNTSLYRHKKISKASGAMMLLASLILFMTNLGILVGFLFALISFMTISGFIILFVPLRKT